MLLKIKKTFLLYKLKVFVLAFSNTFFASIFTHICICLFFSKVFPFVFIFALKKAQIYISESDGTACPKYQQCGCEWSKRVCLQSVWFLSGDCFPGRLLARVQLCLCQQLSASDTVDLFHEELFRGLALLLLVGGRALHCDWGRGRFHYGVFVS